MENWKEYKIQDICNKVVSGGTPLTSNKDYYYPATIPWLKTGEVNYSYIYKTENFISEKGLKNSSAKLIPVNSIIVAMYGQGDTAGRVAVNKIPLSTNQACCNLQINETIAHYAFVYYYLWTQYQQLVLYKTGGAQPNLNVDKIKKLKIQLPPLPTQQKIASILSTYDNLIQNYKKQIEDLQTSASELYKEWFVRFRFPGYKTTQFENGIPVGWKVEKIKNLVTRLPFGQTYKKDELEETGKVIVVDQSEDELLGYHNNEPSHKASLDKPIALFGDHSCKYKLMVKDFSLGENIIPFISKDIDLYYLYFAVYKIVQTEEYKRHWNLFVNKKVFVPTSELQSMFRTKIIPLISKKELLEKQITNLTKQRDLLLPRLMSGKLEV